MAAYNFTVYQGKTFTRLVRWESLPYIYKSITAIELSAPVEITAVAHGLVDGWRVAVVSVKGMEEINAKNSPPKDKDFHKATVIASGVVELNDVNAADFTPYESGGYLQYYTPVDMAGYSARMDIKDHVGGVVLKSLVSPTDIVIDDVAKTIVFTISAVDTATFAVGSYVYDLEMVAATGEVTLLLSGAVEVVAEVTT